MRYYAVNINIIVPLKAERSSPSTDTLLSSQTRD